MLQITPQKFVQIQSKFYQSVMNLPAIITMIVTTIDSTNSTGYDIFVGAQDRVPVEYQVRCLYRRQFSYFERQKYGMSEDCEAMVFIPPQELTQIFGTWQMDWMKVKVRWADFFNNEVYVIDRVVNRSPLHGSCIAVELHLKSEKKA